MQLKKRMAGTWGEETQQSEDEDTQNIIRKTQVRGISHHWQRLAYEVTEEKKKTMTPNKRCIF
jgi:hypothetical protein